MHHIDVEFAVIRVIVRRLSQGHVNMQKLIGLAAFAALSIGTAHAAPTITYTDYADGGFAANFSDTPTTTIFADRFMAFTVTQSGYLVGTIGSTSFSPAQFVNITAANFVGPLTMPSGNPRQSFNVTTTDYGHGVKSEFGFLFKVLLQPGTYRLFVGGTTIGAKATGNFSGTLNFAPVPEPMTWGLMIMGFAGIGTAMRRRSSAQRLRVAHS
jgi:hypothetical protein